MLYDFVVDPRLGPASRIRRRIRSDALKSKNAIDLKSKSKVNEILHDVIDNNNNTPPTHLSKEQRTLIYKKKHSEAAASITNGYHSKLE